MNIKFKLNYYDRYPEPGAKNKPGPEPGIQNFWPGTQLGTWVSGPGRKTRKKTGLAPIPGMKLKRPGYEQKCRQKKIILTYTV